MAQVDPDELRTVLHPFFVTKNEFYDRFIHQSLMIPVFQALPALRGFWPTSSQYESAAGVHNLVDLSGCGQHLLITGGIQRIGGSTSTPNITFSGSGQWCSDSDSAHWDITGTETATASERRGLTIGAWVYFDNAASSIEFILSKRHNANTVAYSLARLADGTAEVAITTDGTTFKTVASSSTIGASAWTFIVGRFDPSTQLDVFVNGEFDENTTSIPASIADTGADFFMAGRDDGGTPGQELLDGSISMAFICASYIPDYALIRLYEISRIAFGVS